MISSAEPAAPGRGSGLRVLFTASARPAQVWPAASLGSAFRAAGHEVLVACEPSLVRAVAETGLAVTAVGRDVVDDLVRVARRWRPDLIVHDTAPVAAAVAGAVLGVPTVGHLGAGPAVPRRLPHPDTGPLWQRYARLFARFGTEPRLEPAAWVDPCPPSMTAAADVALLPVRFVPTHGPGDVPAWLLGPPTRPRVCLPWRAAPADGAGQDTLWQVTAGLTTLDAEIVLTVDPAGRGHPPVGPWLEPLLDESLATVRVVDSVALPSLLRTCDAVVHQGRSVTTLTAAACATPQLIVSNGPEQALSGVRIVALGAGRLLPADELPPGADGADVVGSEAAKLLDRPAYSACARRLHAEIEQQPTPAELVGTLTRLTTDFRASNPGRLAV